jgi:hypothetical protein
MAARASQPVEELPPPASARPEAGAEAKDPQEEVPPVGWELEGQRGRHYFFGPVAIADYRREGRRIVMLRQEDGAEHLRPDPAFLYYREIDSGHRWAFGRRPTAAGRYVVYFQPADGDAWLFFHEARLHFEESDGKQAAPLSAEGELACGRERSILRPSASSP